MLTKVEEILMKLQEGIKLRREACNRVSCTMCDKCDEFARPMYRCLLGYAINISKNMRLGVNATKDQKARVFYVTDDEREGKCAEAVSLLIEGILKGRYIQASFGGQLKFKLLQVFYDQFPMGGTPTVTVESLDLAEERMTSLSKDVVVNGYTKAEALQHKKFLTEDTTVNIPEFTVRGSLDDIINTDKSSSYLDYNGQLRARILKLICINHSLSHRDDLAAKVLDTWPRFKPHFFLALASVYQRLRGGVKC